MKCRSSKVIPARAAVVAAMLAATTATAATIDYKAIEPAAAILYDTPSTKGRKLFLLRKYTPVEVIVAVEGFVKVREPEGAIGWVDKKALSDRRQVIVTSAKAQVRVDANPDAAIAFEAEKGVALELVEPPKEGWAKVKHASGPVGLVRVTQVWGL
jgi:SH3-like domain-containing protein